ncbi:TPA: helix-hairpin-helix domain-containing protein [Streptococcus pyogenes]|uniref:Competence protein n=5 Tax=Lactobacillales TaxID=186826 RepID=Q99Z43_STRP1|nr:ComEA family DNA-binding protein [Streptococcus pyogenes]EPZ42415.1 comEA protein [Streptococcus pyogenes GA41345]EQL77766.1 comEA protein [Streptococcus pyogenes UTSW-2]ERL17241.1 comEA protein [Streptococcus pyogenes GA41046]ESA55446.1 comEA protein [Streptococcus pyogenes GA40377]ESU86713.1 comEA protein [Streptococcus pyogenes GA03799]EZM57669.1 competence protein [Streptococcus pyogenes ABC020046230]KGE56054.1 competence ComEA helix-hairpin-helix repeat region domain protein [Strepto
MLDELLIKGKSFLRERYFLPYLISLLLGLFLILSFSFLFWGNRQSKAAVPALREISPVKQQVSEEKKEIQEDSSILVDLKGAVQKEGVYKLTASSRVRDVIELAGGLTSEADKHAINFAEKLTDEQVVYVPKQGEEISVLPRSLVSGKKETASKDQSKVHINKASLEELQHIPGIGAKRAQDIIDMRDKLGGFKALEDLRQVSGIGEKTLEKLKDDIFLD